MSQATFLNRQALYLRPDPARVIVRPFKPATEPRDLNPTDKTRANHIVDRVLALGPETAASQLADVLENFLGRHRNLLETFEARADEMEEALAAHGSFSKIQRQLIGAYFLNEYSFEASALFNPSIVPHPDQSGAPKGGIALHSQPACRRRRACVVADVSCRHHRGRRQPCRRPDGPARLESPNRLSGIRTDRRRGGGYLQARRRYQRTHHLSGHGVQSHGIEDARFVEFSDGGRKTYYATYTAYSGTAIRSELIETSDFMSFRMTPLQGTAASNKGMALFPRKIDGKYAMIARQDNENLYLIYSSDLYRWDGGQAILKPEFPWEFVQIGNCGSPIELDEGWLLLTHGVGPVRKYSIGAALLDKNDPSKVLARSREPLLRPEPSEREGYVPNVVYTCGAMRHNDQIILPYAVSDSFSNFATIKISCLDAGNAELIVNRRAQYTAVLDDCANEPRNHR